MIEVLLALYFIPLAFIFLYSLVQLSLVFSYLRGTNGSPCEYEVRMLKHKKVERENNNSYLISHNSSLITVQLPIYNEQYVVERLIDNIVRLDYPKNLLEIQVLDDSTDETVGIVAQKVAAYQAQGFDIQHIRRSDRKGYKAGALAHGLAIAKGEFIAIFDADFLPPSDFFKKTLSHFKDQQVGVVQTRWGHLNENASLLTQMQAFGLNAHFVVEQIGRNVGGHFINFNGTAGIWRKICIEDAGGWSADTLTEDLDLSYRSQMRGWKFIYLPNVLCPAELPTEINALKAQQYRWTKGAAECAVKLLPQLFRSNVSISTKIQGFFHLMNSSVFVMIILMALLTLPTILLVKDNAFANALFQVAGFFQIGWVILAVFYCTAPLPSPRWGETGVSCRPHRFLKLFLAFLIFMMGLAVHNTLAVLEAWLRRKTHFVRTPKLNNNRLNQVSENYVGKRMMLVVWLELGFLIYTLFAIAVCINLEMWRSLPFYLMFSIGLAAVVTMQIRSTKCSLKADRR